MTLDALCSASDVLIYDTFNAAASAPASFLFGNARAAVGVGTTGSAVAAAAAVPVTALPVAEGEGEKAVQGRRKRRRRARSYKNYEDAESQRMTHIAVERNRRRQMNEYLAVLRSLMPESYAHRGDQSSIVGGAIDFVKELEQLLQSLEAKKRTLLMQQQQHKAKCDAMPMPSTTSTVTTAGVDTASNCSSGTGSGEEAVAACDAEGPPFAQFFTYPQYVWCHPPQDGGAGAENRAGVADIEVNLVETHASVRVMAPRRPGQLLKMVAGLQALRLTILHLNVTALDSLALYSLSVKVEEGCGLATVDDIAAAVHHVLCIIDAEAASQRLLAGGAAGPLVS